MDNPIETMFTKKGLRSYYEGYRRKLSKPSKISRTKRRPKSHDSSSQELSHCRSGIMHNFSHSRVCVCFCCSLQVVIRGEVKHLSLLLDIGLSTTLQRLALVVLVLVILLSLLVTHSARDSTTDRTLRTISNAAAEVV